MGATAPLIQTEQELLDLGNVDSETPEESFDLFSVSGNNPYYVINRMLDLIVVADSKVVCANELKNVLRFWLNAWSRSPIPRYR